MEEQHVAEPPQHEQQNVVVTVLEYPIYQSRWVLMALYATFMLVVDSYALHAGWGFVRFIVELWRMDAGAILARVFESLDEVMIASALYLITGGSALVYVKEWVNSVIFKRESDRPQAFIHLSASGLKAKMGSSLAGVSAVLLISALVEVQQDTNLPIVQRVGVMAGIHVVLLLSLVVFHYVYKSDSNRSEHA